MNNDTQRNTPWGFANIITGHGKGMYSVSTSSHGGIFLSDDRLLCLPPVLQAAPTFTKQPNWFEEDIDAILPVLAFPAEFSDQACWNAVRMATTCRDTYLLTEACQQFLASDASLPVRNKAKLFEETNRIREKWESGSLSSDKLGWVVHFTREIAPGKKEHREELLKEYPMQQFWTDAEITAARAELPPMPPLPPGCESCADLPANLTFDGEVSYTEDRR